MLCVPQVEVIKKAYLQECEYDQEEVSPREVGHNIYILALQVHRPIRNPEGLDWQEDTLTPVSHLHLHHIYICITFAPPSHLHLNHIRTSIRFNPVSQSKCHYAIGAFLIEGILGALCVILRGAASEMESELQVKPHCSSVQLARHNKILLHLLKPPKRTKEEEEGISSMVSFQSSHHLFHLFDFFHMKYYS